MTRNGTKTKKSQVFADSPVLPHNDVSERRVLAAIISQDADYPELFDSVKTEWFFDPRHQVIFEKLRGIQSDGRRPDLLNLCESQDGLDVAYCASLLDDVAPSEYRTAAAIVAEAFKLREIIRTAAIVARLAEEHSVRAESITEQAIERFSEIAFESRNNADMGLSYREAGVEFVSTIGKNEAPQIMTGIRDLDDLTGGFQSGEVVIFTAETGVGKTVLAQQTRRRACADNFHTLYCSGEMLAKHLISRELATESRVKHWKMRRTEKITPTEFSALVQAVSHECERCHILDGELTLPRIRRASRRMKKNNGIELLIVDYDELVEVPGKDEWEQQRRLVREIKSIAMELNCAAIVVSQLRKALQGEDRKHPTLQRLYGSGAKAKHASIVVYVDRPYVQELTGDETEGRIAVLKNREGRIGQFEAVFSIEKLRFTSRPKPEGDDARFGQ